MSTPFNIEDYVKPLMDHFINTAKDDASVYTVRRRALSAVAEYLKLEKPSSVAQRDCIFIHPDNIQKIETMWAAFTSHSAEDTNTMQFFRSNHDLLPPANTIKLIQVLAKKMVYPRSNESKEKIVKCALFHLLAVDGINGMNVNDLKSYMKNLSVGDVENDTMELKDLHVVAVRKMYQLIKHDVVGNDAATIIILALMLLFKEESEDDYHRTMLETLIDNADVYLKKNAKYYKELANYNSSEFLQTLQDTYRDTVKDVKGILDSQIQRFQNKFKKLKRFAESESNENPKKMKVEPEVKKGPGKRIKMEDEKSENPPKKPKVEPPKNKK